MDQFVSAIQVLYNESGTTILQSDAMLENAFVFANEGIEVWEEKSYLAIPEQPLNAWAAIELTPLGIDNTERALQFANVEEAILVMLLGIVKLTKEEQLLNAPLPMLVTVFGKTMLSMA